MKSKKTKKALTGSVLALVLCFVMLLGTTFAWFTDTASTSVSSIQAGNLDIDLEVATEYEVFIKDNGEIGLKNIDGWESAEGQTLRFIDKDNNSYWEPGCTYTLPPVRVVNNGNLSVKFKIKITGVGGDDKLNEAIEWIVPETYNYDGNNIAFTLDPGAFAAFKIAGHMKEDAGNEYMGLSIDGVAITAYATQATSEWDSTTNMYDADAPLPDLWDGTAATSLTENEGVYHITSAAELAYFAKTVNENMNNYNGKTVVLDSDIDLSNIAWTPIGRDSNMINNFGGTFDGQNHTIYNLNVSSAGDGAGLFGYVSNGNETNGSVSPATIKNLHIYNATVSGAAWVGTVVGLCNSNTCTITGCTVTNSTVSGVKKVGSIAGYITEGVVSGNSVCNCTVLYSEKEGGEIIGYAGSNCNVNDNTATNVSIKKNVTLSEGAGLDTSSATSDATIGSFPVSEDFDPSVTNVYTVSGKNYAAAGTLATFDTIYGSVLLDNVDASCTTLIELNAENTVILRDCNITIAEGGYLVKDNTGRIPQVCFKNVTINGVKVTWDNLSTIITTYCPGCSGNLYA